MAAGLTIEQEQEYNRDKKAFGYLNQYDTQTSSYVPLDEARDKLGADILALENKVTGKNFSTKSITETKEELKHKAALAWEFICTQSWAFCKRPGATTEQKLLASNFNFSESKIFKMDDGEVFPFAEGVNTLVTDSLLAVPAYAAYDVDAAVLTAAIGKATDFKNIIEFSGVIDSGKAAATIAVEQEILDLKEDCELIERLGVRFKESDSDYYNGLKAALKIDDIGIHHQYVEGEVKDGEGNGVIGAVLTVIEEDVEKTKVTKTNFVGHYQTAYLKRGNIILRCEVPGKPTQEKILKVKVGTILHIDFTV